MKRIATNYGSYDGADYLGMVLFGNRPHAKAYNHRQGVVGLLRLDDPREVDHLVGVHDSGNADLFIFWSKAKRWEHFATGDMSAVREIQKHCTGPTWIRGRA